jgi:hypothetical protein
MNKDECMRHLEFISSIEQDPQKSTAWLEKRKGKLTSSDAAPALGGNLDTYTRSIFSSNVAYVQFDDNLAIKTTSVVPGAIANYNIVYAQTPISGGSGLYITNTTNSNRELASSRKAIVYSLVL